MEKESMLRVIGKLAIQGERAGFSVEKMIELLNGGLSVETLLDLIDRRLAADELGSETRPASSPRWIM